MSHTTQIDPRGRWKLPGGPDHESFGLITAALAEAEDYNTLSGWLRFVGLPEGDAWAMPFAVDMLRS